MPVRKISAWWLYILECRGGVLYTGIARDVDARFAAHVKQLPRSGKLRWCKAGLDAFVRTERAARRMASRRAGA